MIDGAFEHWWKEHWTYSDVDPNVECTVKAFARLAFADARALQSVAVDEAQELRAACLAMLNAYPRLHDRTVIVRRIEFERVGVLAKTRPLLVIRGIREIRKHVAPPPTGTAENGA